MPISVVPLLIGAVEDHDKLLTVLQANSMGYYHWMVECLPKLAAAVPLLREHTDIRVLVPRRAFAKKAAAMLGLDTDRFVWNDPGLVFRCKELYFASFTPNLMPPNALIRLGSRSFKDPLSIVQRPTYYLSIFLYLSK